MAYERPPGTGVLFQNFRKKHDKAPDWNGELMLASGETVKISGWTKQSEKGALISLKEDTWKPDPNYRTNQNPAPSKPFVMDDDQDIPF